jgi:hypothetical protein
MNDHDNEFDPRLAELFRREHTHVPAEPFATATVRAVAADRKRVALRNRLLQAAAVIVLILTSSRLIEASVWMSSQLDELFASASTWLASPLGSPASRSPRLSPSRRSGRESGDSTVIHRSLLSKPMAYMASNRRRLRMWPVAAYR